MPRPILQRSPHSSPSTASNRADARSRRPPPLSLLEAEPRMSITDDPFFRQYENPQSARLARLARVQTYQDSLENTQNLSAADLDPIDVNIGVIGTQSSGKSTFIRRSMDLEDEANHPSRSASTFTVGRDFFSVRMYEYTPHEIQDANDGTIKWPADTSGRRGKHIHGAVVLCDVTNETSWNPVAALLDKLQKSSVSTLVVFTKCEQSMDSRQLDPTKLHTTLKSTNPDVSVVSISGDAPDSSRRSISVLLRKLGHRSCSPRPRSNTAKTGNRPSSPAPSHTRATSELSLSSAKSSFPVGDASFLAYNLASRTADGVVPSGLHGNDSSSSYAHEGRRPSATASTVQENTKPFIRLDTQHIDEPRFNETLHATRSFYLDDSPRRGSAGSEISDGGITLAHSVEIPPEQLDYTFDELLDLVLAKPRSSADEKLRKIFLMLYRMFSSALRMLKALEHRYTETTKKPRAVASSKGDEPHLRLLQQWITSYPGDVASPPVYASLQQFLTAATHHKVHASAIQQVLMSLKLVTEDDDTRWGCDDFEATQPADGMTFYARDSIDGTADLKFLHSDPSSPDTALEPNFANVRKRNASKSQNNSELESAVIFRSGSTVALTAMGPSKINDSQTTLHQISNTASRQAALLTPRKTCPFTKLQWRAFIAQPDEQIANELTRIDWIMFSSIRLRDLVRHVMISKDDHHKFSSLVNVERAVEHFNHLAYWVANMVLFRDKPKHRAQALEKLMRIARHLRNLNNYNTLGAIIAGIHGSAVHRLAATKELVAVDTQRDFMKLEILMGTSKASAAYRLAWENTKNERIPFLPMVRKDLVTVLAANKTYSEDSNGLGEKNPQAKINWNKFQIMGDILLSIQAAQAQPYSEFATNDEVRALILDCKITKDDDRLYERSMYLEPPGQTGTPVAVDVIGLGKRRLTGWLNRTA